jgi:hypothetical protein
MALTYDPAAALRENNPDWIIFRTQGGRWWAIHRYPTHADLIRGACVASLDAEDPERLEQLIGDQESRRPGVMV